MKSTIFVAFSLMLYFGQIFGRNIQNESESGQHSDTYKRSEKSTEPQPKFWDPLDLFGLKIDDNDKSEDYGEFLANIFERPIKELDRTMAEQQIEMDRVMEEHRKLFDQFDDKGFDDLHKDMFKMFDSIDKHFREQQKQNPIITPKTEKLITGLVNAVNKEAAEEDSSQNKTGLPVFHPNKSSEALIKSNSSDDLPVLINRIISGFQPMLSDLQKEVEERINSSFANEDQLMDSKWDFIDENISKSNVNSTESEMLSNFFDTVFDSFTNLGKLILGNNFGLENSSNQTSDDMNDSMIVTEDIGNGWIGVKVVECQCPEAMFGRHKEECPMNEQHMVGMFGEKETRYPDIKSTEFNRKLRIAYVIHSLENVLMANLTRFAQADYNYDLQSLAKEGFTEKELFDSALSVIHKLGVLGKEVPIGLIWQKQPVEVTEVSLDFKTKIDLRRAAENRIVDRFLNFHMTSAADEALMKLLSSTPLPIEQKLRQEFRITNEDDDDYEWYDWLLVSLLAITSTLLLIVALFMFVQRSRRTKSVKLDKKLSKDENSVSNENLAQKYTDKIKTIFVNMK